MSSNAAPTRAAGTSWRDRGPFVVLGCAVAYLPFTLLGYGTDIDVANVLRSGGRWVDDGVYEISRPPGAAVHEIGTALLDAIGGPILVNLAGVAFAALALWSVHELTRRDGARWPGWPVLLLAANPWFWLASTSLGDFTWALGLSLGGAAAARREQRVLAGALFGLAVGCRTSSAVVAVAWLVAERLGAADRRPTPTRTLLTAAVFAGVACLVLLPAWLSADGSMAFLEHQTPFGGWRIHLGRWAVKNAAVIGVPAGVVFLLGIRRGFGALARWQASVVVRFAVLSILAFELLFLRFPYKPVHLLPVVAAVSLLVGASPAVTQRWLAALVAAQLLGGVVGSTIGQPDVPHHARGGRLSLQLTEGVLLNDVRCRLDDLDAGDWPDPTEDAAFPAASARAALLFDCQSDTWKVVP